MKKLVSGNTVMVLLLIAASAVAGPVGVIEEIQLPAILSFDYAVGMLGMVYGVDPTFPEITASGEVTSSGFGWTATGATYLGLSLALSANGVYDDTAHSIHWTGGGTYDGHDWTMSGDVEWLSGTEFRARHAIDIAGVGMAFTADEMGMPSWDPGLAEDPPGEVKYKIERSGTWFLAFLFGPSVVDNVTVTVANGIITENTLKIIEGSTKVGVDVKNVGGSIEIDGGEFHKTVKVTPVPEPASLTLLAAGLLGVAGRSWRRRR